MSTITNTNRSINLSIVFALAIILIVVMALAAAQIIVTPKPAFIPVTGDQNSYLEFRRGEWASANANTLPAINNQLLFRRGERASMASAQQAYFDQRLGEYASENAHVSSSTVDNAYLEYRRGEWTGR